MKESQIPQSPESPFRCLPSWRVMSARRQNRSFHAGSLTETLIWTATSHENAFPRVKESRWEMTTPGYSPEERKDWGKYQGPISQALAAQCRERCPVWTRAREGNTWLCCWPQGTLAIVWPLRPWEASGYHIGQCRLKNVSFIKESLLGTTAQGVLKI